MKYCYKWYSSDQFFCIEVESGLEVLENHGLFMQVLKISIKEIHEILGEMILGLAEVNLLIRDGSRYF